MICGLGKTQTAAPALWRLAKVVFFDQKHEQHSKIRSGKNLRHGDAQICPVWHSVQHLKRNYSNTKELPCEWCSCTISAYVALHFYQYDKHKPAWESRCLFPQNLLNISISQQLTACDNDQSTETFWFGSKLFTQKQLFVVILSLELLIQISLYGRSFK